MTAENFRPSVYLFVTKILKTKAVALAKVEISNNE